MIRFSKPEPLFDDFFFFFALSNDVCRDIVFKENDVSFLDCHFFFFQEKDTDLSPLPIFTKDPLRIIVASLCLILLQNIHRIMKRKTTM